MNKTNCEFTIQCHKSYATADDARKAVEKAGFAHLRHFIMLGTEGKHEGRFFPVFIGHEARQHSVHFHFNVLV